MNNLIITGDQLNVFDYNDFENVRFESLNFDEHVVETRDGLDVFLHGFVLNNLNDIQYKKVFIPLCFGDLYSNYLGLRFALHIRTTKNVNQLSNIFIYGTETLDKLVSNNLSKIFFIKGIHLMDFSKNQFKKVLKNSFDSISNEGLSKELSQIKLEIPKNYYDNHSIANEWAISRWSKMLNIQEESDFDKVNEVVEHNLYFKYLKTVHRTDQISPLNEDSLKIKGGGKVLLIDDEVDKGWGEIFDHVFDINNIYLDHIGWDFNKRSKEEIIQTSLDKIIKDDIDVVILDYRLHQDDFKNRSFDAVTGFQLLKRIKNYNKGIQVIIFSATHKIWNIQKLNKIGADGFIIKEGIDSRINEKFLKETIKSFISTIEYCFERKFLKKCFKDLNEIETILIPRKNFKKSNKPLPKEFVDESLKWLELSYSMLNIELNESAIVGSFLIQFSVLENLSNRIINDDPIEVRETSGESKYGFEFRRSLDKLNYYALNNSGEYCSKGKLLMKKRSRIPWEQKILNTLYYIGCGDFDLSGLGKLVTKRNDIVHGNSTMGEKVSVHLDSLVFLNELITNGLKNVE